MSTCPKCGQSPLRNRECRRHGYVPPLTARQPHPKGEPMILRYIPREVIADPEAQQACTMR